MDGYLFEHHAEREFTATRSFAWSSTADLVADPYGAKALPCLPADGRIGSGVAVLTDLSVPARILPARKIRDELASPPKAGPAPERQPLIGCGVLL